MKIFKDRYGKVLAVGDHVIYTDIRYGTGAYIEKGRVTAFLMEGNKAIAVCLNEDGESKSKIEATERLIMKV